MDTDYFRRRVRDLADNINSILDELTTKCCFLDEDFEPFQEALKGLHSLAKQELLKFQEGSYEFKFDLQKYRKRHEGFSPMSMLPPEDTPVLLKGYFPKTYYNFDIGTRKGEKFLCMLSGEDMGINQLDGWRNL